MRKFIKKFVCIAIIFSLCLCSFTSPAIAKKQKKKQRTSIKQISPKPKNKEWYQGGTLHDKTMREWAKSNTDNKLATCGYIIVTAYKKGSLKLDLSSIDTDLIKIYAFTLMMALDKSVETSKENNNKEFLDCSVALASVVGMGLLGWLQ